MKATIVRLARLCSCLAPAHHSTAARRELLVACTWGQRRNPIGTVKRDSTAPRLAASLGPSRGRAAGVPVSSARRKRRLYVDIHLLPHVHRRVGITDLVNGLQYASVHALGAVAGQRLFRNDVWLEMDKLRSEEHTSELQSPDHLV